MPSLERVLGPMTKLYNNWSLMRQFTRCLVSCIVTSVIERKGTFVVDTCLFKESVSDLMATKI